MISSNRISEHPVLNFKRGRKIKFTFDGKEIKGFENETIAAALHAAGIKIYGYTAKKGHPRGFFCAIGKCSSCFVVDNGVPNVRACMTKLKENMKVETQKGRGRIIWDK